MKLYQIIDAIDDDESVSYETIHPYKRSLKTYYADRWSCEPIFMVLFLTNACCWGKIVPSNEFDAALQYETNEESERETISANSFYL